MNETVKRMPLDDNSNKITKRAMKMMSLNERWELPDLTGRSWEIKSANRERYLYLKNLDVKLKFITDEKDKERMIRNAIRCLNTMRVASHWFRYRRAFKNENETQ